MPSQLAQLYKAVEKASDKEKATFLQRFFRTGVGEYGEGDVFAGLTVPQTRLIAREFATLPPADIEKLLHSKIHEERLIALFILVHQFQKFQKTKDERQKIIYEFYLANTKYVNNWDLVDSSAHKIVGEYLFSLQPSPLRGEGQGEGEGIQVLKKLATSKYLWNRRIAMVATAAFIRRRRSEEAFQIAMILLPNRHDLIQKAVGWMLREVGKYCSADILREFLQAHKHEMGRTALRYAIEHFPKEERKRFLKS